MHGASTKTAKISHEAFSFSSVLPGKYRLVISKSDFCWQETERLIEIKSQNMKDIEFLQTGYALQYDAEKEVEVKINDKVVLFKEGKNAHCLAAKGVYQLTPVGCYEFAEATMTYNTNAPRVIKLVPQKYLIQGILTTTDNSLSGIQKHVKIAVKTTDASGKVSEEEIRVDADRTQGGYTFQFFSKGHVTVQITPYVKLQGDSAEANILFYPKVHKLAVTDHCVLGKQAVTFVVNKGLIIRGKITPPVANIVITATDTQDNSVVASTTSTESGEYKLGPLYDDKKYIVTAHKEGYRVTKDADSPYNFVAEQLSYLSIKVSEVDGTPLSGVIFDLSHSARTYRNNTRTDDEGKASFEQLISGDYYLKPLLKEYRFAPEQMALKVIQGKRLTVEFKAHRVAFSAYGKGIII